LNPHAEKQHVIFNSPIEKQHVPFEPSCPKTASAISQYVEKQHARSGSFLLKNSTSHLNPHAEKHLPFSALLSKKSIYHFPLCRKRAPSIRILPVEKQHVTFEPPYRKTASAFFSSPVEKLHVLSGLSCRKTAVV
jgi:hypothetical protein